MNQQKKCLTLVVTIIALLSIFLIGKFIFDNKSEQGQDIDVEVVLSEEISDKDETSETEEHIFYLTLKYDDRYSFLDHSELYDYSIVSITTDSVTSYQVARGNVTSEQDANVIIRDVDSMTDIIACGVGTATVMLESTDNEQEPAKVIVTVEPARLSILFIAGQSNAEGYCDDFGYYPENSILCPEGQIYSSYAPSSNTGAKARTGIQSLTKCTESNVEDFVAGALTGAESISGKELVYPLNALTDKGQGKTGMDSGLAYQWNQLTGDKVWVVNAAWGGTSITTWKPGEIQYERAVAFYQKVFQTMDAELQAGHYTMGHRILFWLQGESDKDMDADAYIDDFRAMHDGFSQEFVGNCQIEYYGIIMVRSSIGSYLDEDELYMTGPRIAQYYLGSSSDDPDVYVVSNENEQWVSDDGVTKYFETSYPDGKLTYPLRPNASLGNLPITVEEVHGNIHYGQAGHNENGLNAANMMYQIITGQQNEEQNSVSWQEQQGMEKN